jgi:Fic-DOC domain mobile mystery protein B
LTDLHQAPNDTTPLGPEERGGLIPSHVALRGELNELERQYILEAANWAFTLVFTRGFARRRNPLDARFALSLHRRMFGQVWRRAGTYRTTDRNFGAEPVQIQPRFDQALDDAKFWSNNKTYPRDEIAVRFHHALVSVHPFQNGNGRWSRLMADMLVVRLGGKRLSWGGGNLRAEGFARASYIGALKAADAHDFAPLLAFARS